MQHHKWGDLSAYGAAALCLSDTLILAILCVCIWQVVTKARQITVALDVVWRFTKDVVCFLSLPCKGSTVVQLAAAGI